MSKFGAGSCEPFRPAAVRGEAVLFYWTAVVRKFLLPLTLKGAIASDALGKLLNLMVCEEANGSELRLLYWETGDFLVTAGLELASQLRTIPELLCPG